MSRNIINKNQRILFQILTIFLSVFSITSILLFRTNKAVLIESLYEELMIFIPGISSLGNLVDETGKGSQDVSKKEKLFKLTKYISNNIPINFKQEEKNNLPELNIFIPYENLRSIQEDRLLAIKKGFLSNPSIVKGIVWHNGEKFDMDVRLKGDLPTHWRAAKRYSLRIKLNKNNRNSKESILGMRTFSLHKLRARAYPYEYIFQDIIAKFNFPSVSHRIVKVKLNGTDWGLMDMQEHWGTEMLEKNKLKNSLILKFGSSYNRDYKYKSGTTIPVSSYWLTNPRLFFDFSGISKKNLLPYQKSQYEYILESLKEPHYYKKLFNDKQLLKLDEILKVWGNFHPIHPENSRFYFNPYTLKLEPLIHDQSAFSEIYSTKFNSIYSYTDGFLKTNLNKAHSNNKLRKKVIYELENLSPYNLSKKLFPGDQFLNIDIPLNNNLKLLEIIKSYQSKSREFFPRNSNNLNCSNFNKKISTYNFPVIKSYLRGNTLYINKLICGDYLVKYAEICDRKFKIDKKLENKDIFINEPYLINVKLENNNLDNCKPNKFKLYYNFNDQNKLAKIEKLNFLNNKNPLLDKNIPSFIKKISNNKYLIKKGDWNVTEPIILDGQLTIEKGSQLKFSRDNYIFIKGDLFVEGTSKEPVIMTSIKKNERWKGLYIYSEEKNEKNSIISNLEINNTKATEVGILNLTGAVTFYNKELLIDNLKISDSIAEDAINIVKSRVKIKNLQINDSESDAFDCDFCDGNIENLTLNRIGGDGLDISGSNIKATINEANNVKDKVVSIGEKSVIDIDINNVKNSYVGAAIKDASSANINFKDIQTQGPIAMSYIKKDFYQGPTKAIITSEDKSPEIIKRFLASNNTSLIVNDVKVQTTKIDVESLYSSGPMKK